MSRALSRRAFLRLGLSLTALASLPRPGPRLAAGLPLHSTTPYWPDAETLAAAAPSFDGLLVPAYCAAELIQQAAVRPLRAAGPPGRAHDPAGAFTRPQAHAVAALKYRGRPPAQPSYADLFQPGALWPAYPRLALAVALLRRGNLPEDGHPGHLARAAQDLAEARPRFVADPFGALQAGAGTVALALVEIARLSPDMYLPAEGRLTVEFDWLIPRAAAQPEAAEASWAAQPPAGPPPSAYFTLAPLPPAVRRKQAALWARLSAF